MNSNGLIQLIFKVNINGNSNNDSSINNDNNHKK